MANKGLFFKATKIASATKFAVYSFTDLQLRKVEPVTLRIFHFETRQGPENWLLKNE